MALEKLVNKKISAAQPNRRAEKTGTAQYIRSVYIHIASLCCKNTYNYVSDNIVAML